MDIDFNMTGAEAVTSKANNLAKSMGRLESAWSKYNRSVSKGSLGGGFLSGIGKSSGGSAAASLIGSAAAFITVQKIMEKLMGDKVKEWSTSLIKEDIKRWKAIGKAIGNFISPLTNNIRANLRLLKEGFKYAARGVADGFRSVMSQAGWSLGGGKLFKRAGVLGKRLIGSPGRQMVGQVASMARFIFTKTPISLMIGAVLGTILLDERISKAVGDFMSTIIGGITNGVSKAFEWVGNLFSKMRMGLARVTNNAYYTGSQVNRASALQQLTPDQQSAYIKSEEKRLIDEDLEEFVIRTRKELLNLFEIENEKRNKEILGIQEIMIYQGRL